MERVVVLLSNGAYCIYQTDRETGLLERIVRPEKEMRDCEGKGVGNQKVKCLKVVRGEIIAMDSEVFNEKLHKKMI